MRVAWIDSKAAQKIRKEAFEKYPLETGGCLLGYFGKNGNIVIEKIIGPGKGAVHKANKFIPGADWQQEEISRIYKESGRFCTYLGDWHSHPKGGCYLSWQDRRTLSSIATDPESRAPTPIMLVVAGNSLEIAIWKLQRKNWFIGAFVEECTLKEYKS